jgi:hypothetical protein
MDSNSLSTANFHQIRRVKLLESPGAGNILDYYACAEQMFTIFFVSPQMETSLEVTNMTRVQQFVLLVCPLGWR